MQTTKKQQNRLKKIITGATIALVLVLNSPFKAQATATPSIDMTSNEIPLVYQLGQQGPAFETRRSNSDTQQWYGPLKISNTITGVNSIKMKFKETGTTGQPFVCPDTGTAGAWANKFASVELIKIAESGSTFESVYLTMGIDLPDTQPYNLTTDSIKTYGGLYGTSGSFPDSYTNWRKNADGTCSMYLADSTTNELASEISSGWYILRLAGTSVDSSTSADLNSYIGFENDDEQKISILGDNSFDISLIAERVTGLTYIITANSLLNGYAPFKPSFPYVEFAFTAPPVIEKESSCNPFTSEITTAFLNLDFSLGSCLKQTASTLFIPSDGISGQFTLLLEQIKQKPPFGWAVATFDILNGLSIDEVTPTFILAGVTPITEDIFTPIRTGLSWLLYFTFTFYLFKRFKDIHI